MDDGEDNEVGVLAMHSLIHGSIITVLLHRHLWQCMTVSNVAAYYSCGLWRGRPNATAAPMRRDTVAGHYWSRIVAGAAPLQEQRQGKSDIGAGAASLQEQHRRGSSIAAGAASTREQYHRRSGVITGVTSPQKLP